MTYSKKIYQLMSLLIAISLWVYVVAEENIFQEKNFTVDVQYENLDSSLIPSAKMPTVNVTIRGDNLATSAMKASDFNVKINLENAVKGENEYEVVVEAPLGARVVSVSPKKVYVNIDEKIEKQVPLKVNLSGKTMEGFSNFEPSLKTSHVTVSGPRTMIEEIHSVDVDVNLDNVNSNLSLKLIPRIRGLRDQVDEDLIDINPGLVDIFIPVIENNPSKSIPVVVPLNGIPAYGYKVSRIVLDPDIVRISGATELIENIREIRTTPIDISNAQNELVMEVGINVPENITLVYEDKIRVVIIFEKNVVEKRVEKRIEIRNAPEGSNLKSNIERITMVLKGEDLAFREFLLENLEVYVDASDFSSSKREFEVQVKKPSNIEVVEVNPLRVTLTREE